jgi:hypothetical protein
MNTDDILYNHNILNELLNFDMNVNKYIIYNLNSILNDNDNDYHYDYHLKTIMSFNVMYSSIHDHPFCKIINNAHLIKKSMLYKLLLKIQNILATIQYNYYNYYYISKYVGMTEMHNILNILFKEKGIIMYEN